jgi:hypothetical protein
MHLFSLFSYDGANFIKNIEAGVEDRLRKRGKPLRIVRYFLLWMGTRADCKFTISYIHNCTWFAGLFAQFAF